MPGLTGNVQGLPIAAQLNVNKAQPQVQDPTTMTAYNAQPMEVVNPNISRPDALREQMAQELVKSQGLVDQTNKRLGMNAPAMRQEFSERGIRLGKKAVASDEFNKAMETQKQVIDRYVQQSGFTDQVHQGLAANAMESRLNKLRQELTRKAMAFEAKLKQQGASEEEKRQMAGNFGAAAGAITGGIVGSMLAPGVGTMAGAQVGAGLGGNIGAAQGGK